MALQIPDNYYLFYLFILVQEKYFVVLDWRASSAAEFKYSYYQVFAP